MRKTILLAIALTVLFGVNVYAKSGDVVGDIYSTDILAFINDVPVPSYNIGGKTVIILEDLADYCVQCTYNDYLRTLLAYSLTWDPNLQKQVARGSAGRVTGKIYETDIKTYVNGMPVQAYSLNGKMAVAIEDIGKITDPGMEYSPYNMRFVWDSKERTVSLYFLYDNSFEIMDLLAPKSLVLSWENDVIRLYADQIRGGGVINGSLFTGDFNPPTSYPLYFNGERAGMGFRYKTLAALHRDDGTITLDDGGYNIGCLFDTSVIKDAVDSFVVPKLTYEDVLKYYTEELYSTILEREDTNDGTFLYISQSTPHGPTEFLVLISKNGSYKDYADEFKSVSLYGTKAFSNVRIENGKVYFHYDTDYVIDLSTGVMTAVSKIYIEPENYQ